MSPQEQFEAKITAEGEIYFTPVFWQNLKEIEQEIVEGILLSPEVIEALQQPMPLYWKDIRDYDLSEARKDFRIDDFPEGGGDIVLVKSYTGKAEIKFDSPNADSFDLETYKKIKHTYTDIYLTNEAQEGATIKILFGRGDWDLQETVPDIDLQGKIRNDYLEPITDPLNIGQIISDGHIVPHADIACEKILITGTTRLDQWRSTDDYTYIAPGKILLHATTKLSDWQHPSDMTYIHGGQIYTESITAQQIAAAAITAEKIASINADISTITAGGGKVVIDENGILITDGNFRMTGKTKGDVVIGDIAGDHLFWDQDAGKLYIVGETEFTGGELGWSHILDDDGNRPLDAWRYTGKTTIDGGQIETDTVTAVQVATASLTANELNISDLAHIANLLTVAAGKILIGANVLGESLHGMKIVDEQSPPVTRVKIGHVEAGSKGYGINIIDEDGTIWVDKGDPKGFLTKIYDNVIDTDIQSLTISGLDGDSDIVYLLVLYIVGKPLSSEVDLRFNSDSGDNYGWQHTQSGGTTVSGLRTTYENHIALTYCQYTSLSSCFAWISAKTGKARAVYGSSTFTIVPTTSYVGRWRTWGGLWVDTTHNITSINLVGNKAKAIGAGSHILLYSLGQ